MRAGQIASVAANPAPNDVAELRRLARLDVNAAVNIRRWGDGPVTASHTEHNSYLGNVQAIKQAYGTVPDN